MAYQIMFFDCVRDLKSRLVLVALATLLLAAACADPSTYAPPRSAMNAPTAALVDRPLRIGIGDKLKIAVFGEENLSSQVEVGAAGQIAMPLLGEIKAHGRTPNELKDAIARRLSDGYLKNPKVSVELLTYRPIYVHGEVKSGGEFPFKNGLTFRDAVAIAGGYTYRANQGYVLLAREGGEEQKLALPTTVPVLPGDNIRIPERFF